AEEIALDASPRLERHTFDGDLALLRNRPREAIQHYSRSLELAEERNNHVQIYNDLFDLADALAMNNNDLEALEIAGIAEAQILDQSGSTRFAWHVQGRDYVLEAEKRVGAEAAAQAKKRGREVSAGYRVTRARELVQAAGQPVSP